MSTRTITIAPYSLPGDSETVYTEVGFTLVDSTGAKVDGYRTDDNTGILATFVAQIEDDPVTVDLTPNDQISPVDTVWEVSITSDCRVIRRYYPILPTEDDSPLSFPDFLGFDAGQLSPGARTYVIGPETAIDGNMAVFDGATGTYIRDGGPPGTSDGDGGGHIIYDNDTQMPQRAGLEFQGAQVDDDIPNGRTVIAGLKGDTGDTGATGAAGAAGDPGAPGDDGDSAYEIAVANGFVGTEQDWLDSLEGTDGINGTNGYTWHSGVGTPNDLTGVDGDWYLQTSTSDYYGPKAGGTWVGTGPTSLIGAAGPSGAAGADGKTWHSDTGAPNDGTGVDGDFFLDTTADAYYGPKGNVTPGSWTGTGPQSLIGPQGIPGEDGEDGTSITIVGSQTWAWIAANAPQVTGETWILEDADPAAPPPPGGGNAAAGDGVTWTGSEWSNLGPLRGPQGEVGPAGPAEVSADAGNFSRLGTDTLIFTPEKTSILGATGFTADPVGNENTLVGTIDPATCTRAQLEAAKLGNGLTVGRSYFLSDELKWVYATAVNTEVDFLPGTTTLNDLGGEPEIDPKLTAFNKNFGAAADTVCEGDDARLSDARAPLEHHATHEIGGTDVIDYQNLGIVPAGIGAEPEITPKGTAFNQNFGTGTTDVCRGDDSRLSDARTPTLHASSHATGQPDELTPADIGAASAAEIASYLPLAGGEMTGTITGTAADIEMTDGHLRSIHAPMDYDNPSSLVGGLGVRSDTDATHTGGIAVADNSVTGSPEVAIGSLQGTVGTRIVGPTVTIDSQSVAMTLDASEPGSTLIVSGHTQTGEAILGAIKPLGTAYEEPNSDSRDIDLGTGAGAQAWVLIVTLAPLAQDCSASLTQMIYQTYAAGTGTDNSNIEIGFGIAGVGDGLPVFGDYVFHELGTGSSGVSCSDVIQPQTDLSAGQVVSLYARLNGTGVNSAATIQGATISPSTFTVRVIQAATDTGEVNQGTALAQPNVYSGMNGLNLEFLGMADGTAIEWASAATALTADLKDVPALTPAQYIYPAVTVDQKGRATAIEEQATLPIAGSISREIIVNNATDTEIGRIGHSDDGAFLAATNNGTYEPANGGIWAGTGVVELHGNTTQVASLAHSATAGYRTVAVSPEGFLFGQDPAEPGWDVPTSDAADYDTFGAGTGAGPWVRIVGCSANPAAQVLAGATVEMLSQIYVSNSSGRNVSAEIGYGVNGADPTYPGTTYAVIDGQEGLLPPDFRSIQAAAQYETSDTIDLFVRRASGDHASSSFEVWGATGSPSTFTLSAPSASGGGGDPTNLGIGTVDATTVQITSSTGLPVTIPAATQSTAGVLSATDKTALDNMGGSIPDTATLSTGTGLSGGGNLVDNLTIKVTDTGVVAAEYTNPTITVDSMGRITAAADGDGFPARVAVATATPSISTPIDGKAYTVQLQDGDDITAWIHSGGPTDYANFEYTCSVDFLPPATGSASVSPPVGAQLMSGADVFTIDNTGTVVSAILHTKADGLVQLYTSETSV